jgi:hypothetical protein
MHASSQAAHQCILFDADHLLPCLPCRLLLPEKLVGNTFALPRFAAQELEASQNGRAQNNVELEKKLSSNDCETDWPSRKSLPDEPIMAN